MQHMQKKWNKCTCSCQRMLISVFSVSREKICLCCYHFTVSDLGLSLPSVCCKETGPQLCISLMFGILFICTVPCHITSFFFLFFLLCLSPFHVCITGVSSAHPSWKWEGRFRRQGQLEGLCQHFLLAFEMFFLVKKIVSTPPLCLQCTVFFH